MVCGCVNVKCGGVEVKCDEGYVFWRVGRRRGGIRRRGGWWIVEVNGVI